MSNEAPKYLPRTHAARLIEDVRKLLALRQSPEDVERFLDRQYGISALEACTGSAHKNPHIDNCGVCAPRWGWVGQEVKVR